jgi:hypothetical protein
MGRGWRCCAPAAAGGTPSGLAGIAAAPGATTSRATGRGAGVAPPPQQGPQQPGQPQHSLGAPEREGAPWRPVPSTARPIARPPTRMSMAGAAWPATAVPIAIVTAPLACESIAIVQHGRPTAVEANVPARSAAAPRRNALRARTRRRAAARTMAAPRDKLRCVTVSRESRQTISELEPARQRPARPPP